MNYTDLLEECREAYILRVTDGCRFFSLFLGMVTVLLLLASLVWWWKYRDQSRLTLRTESSLILVFAYGFLGALSYSFYTFSLDEPSLINSCAMKRFCTLMGIICFIAVIYLRLYSYYAMSQIYQAIMKLAKREGRINVSVVTTKNYTESGSIQTEDSILEKLVYKSSEAYSFKLVIATLVIGSLISFLLIYATCPILSNGVTCENGDNRDVLVVGFTGTMTLLNFAVLVYVYLKTRKFPDPFGVKKEALVLFVTSFVFTVIYVIATKIADAKFADDVDDDYKLHITPTIIGDIDLILVIIYAIPYQIWRSIKAEKKSIMRKSLGELLKDKVATDLLKIFLKGEISCNNLDFYIATVNWKKNYSGTPFDVRDKQATNIYNRWVSVDSKHEVNIGFVARHHLEEAMKKPNNFPNTLFDELLDEIYVLISNDSFVRFKRTAIYKIYTGLIVDADEIISTEYSIS